MFFINRYKFDMVVLLFISLFFVSAANAATVTSSDVQIVGGHDTNITSHPWQISLQLYGYHMCGGSLIDDKVVLTAAHCVQSTKNLSTLTIKVGSTYKSTGGQILKVRAFRIHEGWGTNFRDNDIAIVYLESNPTVPDAQKIALPQKNTTIPKGAEFSVTGWGSTIARDPDSEILQEVLIPFIPLERCQFLYEKGVTDLELCAGVDGKGGKDACQGDSGGPAVYNGELVGIVSWGKGCGRPNYPGVYTRVDRYLDWISEKLNELVY